MRKFAFTLIEFLIVIAILGVIVGGITQMVVTTLKVSTLAQVQAEQITTLKDATGYISDQVRSAIQIYDSLTIDGTACTTSTTASSTTGPCFGVQIPVVDSSGNITANSFEVRVYRLRLRSGLSATYKTTNTWADSNTYVIEEYRVTCTSSTCPANAGSVSSGTWYLVTHMVSLSTSTGTAVTPFTVINNSSSAPFGVQINLVGTGYFNGKQVYVPSTGVYTTIVKARNIANNSSTY